MRAHGGRRGKGGGVGKYESAHHVCSINVHSLTVRARRTRLHFRILGCRLQTRDRGWGVRQCSRYGVRDDDPRVTAFLHARAGTTVGRSTTRGSMTTGATCTASLASALSLSREVRGLTRRLAPSASPVWQPGLAQFLRLRARGDFSTRGLACARPPSRL